MAFTEFTNDLAIIQKLDDEPNDVGGLSAAELKAKFDEGSLTIQDYINNVLLAELAGTAAPANIGAYLEEYPAVVTLQQAIEKAIEIAKEATAGTIIDNTIVTRMLANLAVTTAKLANLSVTQEKLAANAVSTAKVEDGAIATAELADLAVTTVKLAAMAVTGEKIAENTIPGTKLANYAVTAIKLGQNAVTTEKINAAAVTTEKIADDAVTNDKIAADAVSRDSIADGAVTDVYTATIGTTWTGDAAPYSQSVAVEGLLSTDNPIIDIVPSDTYATAQAQMDAWAEIYKMVAGNGTLTVYANSATETAVDIQILCVRK